MPPKYPIISQDPQIQADYIRSRKAGSSHNLAEMLALQQPPGLQTDTRFMTGENTNYRYCDQLARFPGDPEAYISSRADVSRICHDRGKAVEGSVRYNPVSEVLDASDDYNVADEIVESEVQSLVEQHGESVIRDDPELRTRLKDRFSGRDEGEV